MSTVSNSSLDAIHNTHYVEAHFHQHLEYLEPYETECYYLGT